MKLARQELFYRFKDKEILKTYKTRLSFSNIVVIPLISRSYSKKKKKKKNTKKETQKKEHSKCLILTKKVYRIIE